MKCLFVFSNGVLSSNFGGGPSRYLTSFLALRHFGFEVHVLRLIQQELCSIILSEEQLEKEKQRVLRAQAASWRDIVLPKPRPATCYRLSALRDYFFRPAWTICPELEWIMPELSKIVELVRPDFIWAEGLHSGVLMTRLSPKAPWVYDHTDWSFKLKRIRASASGKRLSVLERLAIWSTKLVEVKAVRSSGATITGSYSEAKEIRESGGRNVHLVETTYEPVSLDFFNSVPASPPIRLVHLGSLGTTSNRLGLLSFMTQVQPILQREGLWNTRFQLFIIGDDSRAKGDLKKALEDVGAILKGHVLELGTVLRPFDIAILPYEYDSGTRTKLPLLFNYAQVVVATEAAVAGSTVIEDGENCCVIHSLREFPRILSVLASDASMRQRIGWAARRTFERCFTLEAQLPNFVQVLESLGLHIG